MAILFFYLLPYDLVTAFKYGLLGPIKIIYWNLINIVNDPITLVFQGSKVHLWFLVSLAIAVVITAAFIRFWKFHPLIFLGLFSLFLYIFGLLAGTYSATSIGMTIDFNTRNGPFFSTIFFVMGYLLSYIEITKKHFYYGLIIMCIGYTIQFGEMYYLYSFCHVSPIRDYFAGTLFVGLGVSLMALSNHPLLNSQRLSELGKYTPGIYGIHMVFVDILRNIDKQVSNPVWEVGYVIIVLLLSTGAAVVLSKFKPLRKVIV